MLAQQKIKTFIRHHKIKLSLLCILSALYYFWLPNKLFNTPYSKLLLDANNELLTAQIAADGQWRFPKTDSVPYKFRKCITIFEDEYFYYHPGINPISIFKSLQRNMSAGRIKSGGSTITMQLARMMRHNQPRNYYQKLVELLLAVRIELSYKKSSILNTYCANAPFGSNVVGLPAAAWRYFGRSPQSLSWAESAVLAVLPNSPSLIYPGKNHQRLLQKRNRLLKKLVEKKVIDNATYQLALNEPLPQKPFQLPQLAPHLLARAIKENPNKEIVTSTINKHLQIKATEQLNTYMAQLQPNQIHNACAIIAETATGKVLAYIGNSSSSKNEHNNFVDIIQSPRSTGSILKPFLYAFLLSENKLMPSALLEDTPIQFGAYGPRNFNLEYDGLVPANEAITRSLNVPAVKMLQDYGVARFHQRLRQLGFKTFTKSSKHYGLSLILGGGEATLWDLASAYASMGRALLSYSTTRELYQQNNYHPLNYLITSEAKQKSASQKTDLISASAIYSSFLAMTELLRPNEFAGWQQFLSKNKIAWKTGTSFGFRDAWAIGVNTKYTVAVWVGNASGEGRPGLTGIGAAAPLMFNLFNLLSQAAWFQKPITNFEKINVCRVTGFKASESCNDIIRTEAPLGASKTTPCPFHKFIYLDETETYRVNSQCYPVSKMKISPWLVISPLQEYYYRQKSAFYKPLPNYLPDCQPDQNYKQLQIIYPHQNFKIYIPIDYTGNKSRCIFRATHKNPLANLYWYIDGTYVGTTQKLHELSVLPNAGSHTLEVFDNLGESEKRNFELMEK